MNASRFRVVEKKERLQPGPSPRRRIKWIALVKSKSVRDLAAKASAIPERRLFALVSRAQPKDSDTQPVRRVLIFDNHPATLRLLAGPPAQSEAGAAVSTALLVVYCVLTLALIGVAVFALFRPLIAH